MRLTTARLPVTDSLQDLSPLSSATEAAASSAPASEASSSAQTSPASESTWGRFTSFLAAVNPVNYAMRHGPQVVTDGVVAFQDLVWDQVDGLFKDPTPVYEALQATCGIDCPNLAAGLEYNVTWGEAESIAEEYARLR